MPQARPSFEHSYRPTAFWVLAGVILVVAALMLKPFVAALAWSIVLTVLTRPIYENLRKRWGENAAAILTVFAALLLVFIPLVLVGLMMYAQLNGYLADYLGQSGPPKDLNEVLANVQNAVKPIAANLGLKLDLVQWFDSNRPELTKSLQNVAGKVLVTVGTGAFTMVVALLTMFFMLRDGHRLYRPAVELLPIASEHCETLIQRMADTIRAVFAGVVLVSLIQATIATILYWACGVPSPLVFGVATFVLCTIPLLGGPVMYVPLGLVLLAQGHTTQAIVLWAIGFGLISNVDNILRPFIIGARVQMHPIGVFFSLLGGVFLFGPVGIMVGPVILTALVGLQDVIRISRAEAPAEAP